ncbi:EAL domain-containing protein [Desulfovibrio gilichinskyi]|uniref:EAL domain, c-di-GMP-specific phosphodiesterase class I (Or its enzymatically inactive variant) n=1 Tax=Desulfovibrio gilichinskyi TaxID=1519643 RepID=A0A1X7D378_9BACT|nr:EAL domain-containing protein [Desulfovibrio gilichinskyi]SMF07767.1 EAL domain, c-di-GMP-specific phosphodiesterase class I (or its enzymatically inactive variant) [Desulfovibrio gilichinskyi]
MENLTNECLISIDKILDDESIEVYFQPILSLESKGIIGFEAFSRGVNEAGKTIVEPVCMFSSSLPPETQLKVEKLCVNNILKSFKNIHLKYKNMILFLNVNSNVYNLPENEKQYPFKTLESYNFNPRTIAFEFEVSQLEKKIPLSLIGSLQKSGYRISLDNTRVSLAGLEVVFKIRPDFVKLDRFFFGGIDKSNHKKNMVRAASLIFEQAGAMPVAKGVETEAEALALAESGFYLQQGFFYANDSNGENGSASFSDKIAKLNSDFRAVNIAKFDESRERFAHFHLVLKGTVSKLQQEELSGLNNILKELVKKERDIVSVFVLDASGKQVSQRFVGRSGDLIGRTVEMSVTGSDHSHEDYFMYLNSGLEKVAGIKQISAFCREDSRYIAGFFYRDDGRRGLIMVLEYLDKSQKDD